MNKRHDGKDRRRNVYKRAALFWGAALKMRLSFAYFALALPLLAASQTNYTISNRQIGYYIYATPQDHLYSSVNITIKDDNNPYHPPPLALTVSPTLTGNSDQNITITNGSLHIGIYIDPNNGPLVVWTDTPYNWKVSPQSKGGYSVMAPQHKKVWFARSDYKDILLVSPDVLDGYAGWAFNKTK
ncbi:hypothetical protein F5887DRAFT_1286974 [Amanita rubescens]|nr:hypothetical protein F5887DRAFT_1286979 [Amanita rubescens]KAF8331225.1 hypothetical protein F5887DRAFT_1286974 [Amanita rubescens]